MENLLNRAKKYPKQNLEFLLLIALVTIYFVWFAWPLIWSASESIRLVSVFNLDESLHARLLKIAVEESSLNIKYYNYGHLYFYVSLLPLLVLSNFTPISEQAIIVSLRLVTAIFGVGTVLITFELAKRYFGHLTAWLSVCLLMILPLNFLIWSVTSHPDIPQLFFVVLSIYFCLRLAQEGHWRWLVWASVGAGLAFSSKYSGAFLLPLVWLVMIIQDKVHPGEDGIKISTLQFTKGMRFFILLIGIVTVVSGIIITLDFPPVNFLAFGSALEETQQVIMLNFIRGISILVGGSLILLTVLRMLRPTKNNASTPIVGINRIVLKVILSTIVFWLAFALTSPYALVGMGFLVGMLWESSHVSSGPELGLYHNGRLWFDLLMSPQLLDGIVLSLTAGGLVLTIYTLFKAGWKGALSPSVVLWAWVIFYLGFLVVRVTEHFPRFLLPIIPFLIILAMGLVHQLFYYVAHKVSKKYVSVLAVGIVLVIVGLEFPGAFGRVVDFRNTTIHREQANRAVAAGEWLMASYPPSTPIVYDDYSYVPPQFSNAHLSPWTGETISMLDRLNPELVIVSHAIASRFSNLDQADDYGAGERNFMGKYEYYRQLENSALGYHLIKDFGEVQVYARQQ